MKTNNITLIKIEADEGKVFDWKNLEEHTYIDEDGNTIQEHLFAKTLFLAITDSVDNYIEVDAPIGE